jgi:hypothetical protein
MDYPGLLSALSKDYWITQWCTRLAYSSLFLLIRLLISAKMTHAIRVGGDGNPGTTQWTFPTDDVNDDGYGWFQVMKARRLKNGFENAGWYQHYSIGIMLTFLQIRMHTSPWVRLAMTIDTRWNTDTPRRQTPRRKTNEDNKDLVPQEGRWRLSTLHTYAITRRGTERAICKLEMDRTFKS